MSPSRRNDQRCHLTFLGTDAPNAATVEACLKTLKWLRTNIEDLPIVNAEASPVT